MQAQTNLLRASDLKTRMVLNEHGDVSIEPVYNR